MSFDGHVPWLPGLNVEGVLIDSFAGHGGASTGIEQATHRCVDLAINHDEFALAVHQANHPTTRHMKENVWHIKADRLRAEIDGRRVGLLWASFDCRDFSKAKGGKPRSKKIRGLCWWVLRALDVCQPRVCMGENVEEFTQYGPLLANGKRCPKRKGRSFRRWIKGFERRGYKIEWRILKACDYGAPTTRKRFFFIARNDGLPIVWPEPTHAEPKKAPALHLQKYRTAADCIDLPRPMLSIFATKEEARAFSQMYGVGIPKRPLEPATLRRIVRGLWKFVLDPLVPLFLVGVRHHGGGHLHCVDAPMVTVPASDRELGLVRPFFTEYYGNGGPVDVAGPLHTQTATDRFGLVSPLTVRAHSHGWDRADAWSPSEQVPTVVARDEFGLAAPVLVQTGYGERRGQATRVLDLFKPLGTVVDGVKHGVAAVHIVNNFSERATGGWNGGHGAGGPMSTVTANDHHAVSAANLVVLRNNCDAESMFSPSPTACASGNHIGLVQALLLEHAPDGADLSRLGIVNVGGVDRVIGDVFFRMLEPRELFRAQGFPDSYVIDPDVNVWDAKAKKHRVVGMSKKRQVRGAGNSVCPPVARALVEANFKQPVTAGARAA